VLYKTAVIRIRIRAKSPEEITEGDNGEITEVGRLSGEIILGWEITGGKSPEESSASVLHIYLNIHYF